MNDQMHHEGMIKCTTKLTNIVVCYFYCKDVIFEKKFGNYSFAAPIKLRGAITNKTNYSSGNLFSRMNGQQFGSSS